MWFPGKAWSFLERVLTERAVDRAELEKERALRQAAETRLAANQSTIEWLTMWVNKLETSNGALQERVLGISLPPLEVNFGREPAPAEVPPAPPPPMPTTARAQPMARSSVPAVPSREGERPQSLQEYITSGAVFEDMGDRAASEANIQRDPFTGEVIQ